MDFALDSSLVLAAIVVLWLVWVAPFVLRRTRSARAANPVHSPKVGAPRPEESMITMAAAQQDSPRPATRAPQRWNPLITTARASRSFSPRGVRVALALTGLLALLTGVTTLGLSLFGIVSPFVPIACAVLTALAVAALRLLAVRGRHARVNRAFADAMAPRHEAVPAHARAPQPIVPAEPRRPTTLFDAEEHRSRPLTAMELRTAALAVAHGSSLVDVRSEVRPDIGIGTSGSAGAASEDHAQTGSSAWEPVEVPKPTYLEAPKVERDAPAPLDLPEAPRASSKTPIKVSVAAARRAAADDTTDHDAASESPAAGRIDLDAVLQRRRA